MLVLGFAAPAQGSVQCPGDDVAPASASDPGAGQALLCDMNAVRQQNGLQPLRWNGKLWTAAQGMASDIARMQFMAHTTPDGRTLEDRVGPTGYINPTTTQMLAENLGWGPFDGDGATPLAITAAWLASPEHRENLLDPTLQEVGVGIAIGAPSADRADGVIYVADFGDPGVVAPSRVNTARPSARALGRARCSKTSRQGKHAGHDQRLLRSNCAASREARRQRSRSTG